MTNRISACLAALATLILCLPVPAEAFTGRRGTRVNPIATIGFEVIARTAGSSADYWCGAGEYAHRVVNAPWTTRIYVLRGRGPSVTTGRRSAVQFTLDPAAAGVVPQPQGLIVDLLAPGYSMQVQLAVTYCEQPPVRP